MKIKRILRRLFGLALLVLFAFALYHYFLTAPKSGDSFSPPPTAAPVSPTPVPVSETPEPQEAEPQETPLPEESPEPALPNVDINSWELILVNAENAIGADFAPETQFVGDLASVDARIADALSAFAQGARDQGLPVYLSSGYRSFSEQQANYNAKLNSTGSYETAAKIVAPPGTSEHQTGLCCDITDIYRNPKTQDECEATETYQWLLAHCQEYGFILRYPKGKEDVTGIIYEPWHFRYVGTEAAAYIMENGLCLEEFLALYN